MRLVLDDNLETVIIEHLCGQFCLMLLGLLFLEYILLATNCERMQEI